MTTYTLHLNEAQLAAISQACEVLGRLGLCQFRDALECLPTTAFEPEGWHDDMHAIDLILRKYIRPHEEWRIGNQAEKCRTAWDLYQVARHRLAWDSNPGGNPMSVMFDPPMKTGPEPLAWIERNEK